MTLLHTFWSLFSPILRVTSSVLLSVPVPPLSIIYILSYSSGNCTARLLVSLYTGILFSNYILRRRFLSFFFFLLYFPLSFPPSLSRILFLVLCYLNIIFLSIHYFLFPKLVHLSAWRSSFFYPSFLFFPPFLIFLFYLIYSRTKLNCCQFYIFFANKYCIKREKRLLSTEVFFLKKFQKQFLEIFILSNESLNISTRQHLNRSTKSTVQLSITSTRERYIAYSPIKRSE